MPITTVITTADESHLAIAPILAGGILRDFADRSKGSEIGYVLCPRTNTAIKSESGIEHNAVFVLYSDREIERVFAQSARIDYTDAEGKPSTHTLDLRARRWDRYIHGVLVKPDGKSEELRELAKRLAPKTPKTVADELNIVTDRDLPDYAVQNARLVLSCRREDRDQVDVALAQVAPTILGDISIADLCAELGEGGMAFRPIVRAIFYGTLDCVTEGPITPATLVRFSGCVMPDLDADGPVQQIDAVHVDSRAPKPRRIKPGTKRFSYRRAA